MSLVSAAFLSIFYFDELSQMASSLSEGWRTPTIAGKAPVHGTKAGSEAGAGAGAVTVTVENGFARKVFLRAARNGHFYANAYVNGRSIPVVIDTGATGIHLTYEDARRIGFIMRDSDYRYRSRTANGVARMAIVRLDKVRVGDIEVRDLSATVSERGKLFKTLLGMAFLKRLASVRISGGNLELVQ